MLAYIVSFIRKLLYNIYIYIYTLCVNLIICLLSNNFISVIAQFSPLHQDHNIEESSFTDAGLRGHKRLWRDRHPVGFIRIAVNFVSETHYILTTSPNEQ